MTTSIIHPQQTEFSDWTSMLYNTGSQKNILPNIPQFFKDILSFYNLDVIFTVYDFKHDAEIRIPVLIIEQQQYKGFIDRVNVISKDEHRNIDTTKKIITQLEPKKDYSVTALIIDKTNRLNAFVKSSEAVLQTPVLGFSQINCYDEKKNMQIYMSGLASISTDADYKNYIEQINAPKINIGALLVQLSLIIIAHFQELNLKTTKKLGTDTGGSREGGNNSHKLIAFYNRFKPIHSYLSELGLTIKQKLNLSHDLEPAQYFIKPDSSFLFKNLKTPSEYYYNLLLNNLIKNLLHSCAENIKTPPIAVLISEAIIETNHYINDIKNHVALIQELEELCTNLLKKEWTKSQISKLEQEQKQIEQAEQENSSAPRQQKNRSYEVTKKNFDEYLKLNMNTVKQDSQEAYKYLLRLANSNDNDNILQHIQCALKEISDNFLLVKKSLTVNEMASCPAPYHKEIFEKDFFQPEKTLSFSTEKNTSIDPLEPKETNDAENLSTQDTQPSSDQEINQFKSILK